MCNRPGTATPPAAPPAIRRQSSASRRDRGRKRRRPGRRAGDPGTPPHGTSLAGGARMTRRHPCRQRRRRRLPPASGRVASPFRRLLAGLCLGAPLAAQAILPPPPAPPGNPSTPAKVLLGKALFFDEQLSSSRSMACATCHVFAHGGADPRSRDAVHPGADLTFGTADDVHGSPGVMRHYADGNAAPAPLFSLEQQVTTRRAPSVINAAYAGELSVDGRSGGALIDPTNQATVLPAHAALEQQALEPLLSEVEMSHVGRTWTDISNELPYLVPLRLCSNVPPALQQFVAGMTYRGLFQQAYGTPDVTPVRIVSALAAYQRTLISDQSPFDLHLAGRGTLPPLAQAGLARFQVLCAGCHTDLQASVLQQGLGPDDYRNIGVRPPAEDPGRAAVTNDPADRGRFRVPSLRNVALRAPYFHDGSAADLGAVIDFYARGGDDHDNQDPLVQAAADQFTAADRPALISLLQTLTDPRVAQELPPFDRPQLASERPGVLQRFGIGVGGATMPRSAWLGPAVVGEGFCIGVDRVPSLALSVLLLDPLRNPAPAPVQGHEFYLAGSPAMIALWRFTGAGFATVRVTVPYTAGLAGATVYGQWLVLDALAPAGFASSDAFGYIVLP